MHRSVAMPHTPVTKHTPLRSALKRWHCAVTAGLAPLTTAVQRTSNEHAVPVLAWHLPEPSRHSSHSLVHARLQHVPRTQKPDAQSTSRAHASPSPT